MGPIMKVRPTLTRKPEASGSGRTEYAFGSSGYSFAFTDCALTGKLGCLARTTITSQLVGEWVASWVFFVSESASECDL